MRLGALFAYVCLRNWKMCIALARQKRGEMPDTTLGNKYVANCLSNLKLKGAR